MKAKDTVMKREEVNQLWEDIDLGSEIPEFAAYGETHPTYKLLKAQAEISFKARVEEVTKWLIDNCMISVLDKNYTYKDTGTITFQLGNLKDSKEWQAKLKEWGIE